MKPLAECPQCGAVGTIVDLGACCRIRAKIAAEGGQGGALPQDIAALAIWRNRRAVPETWLEKLKG